MICAPLIDSGGQVQDDGEVDNDNVIADNVEDEASVSTATATAATAARTPVPGDADFTSEDHKVRLRNVPVFLRAINFRKLLTSLKLVKQTTTKKTDKTFLFFTAKN